MVLGGSASGAAFAPVAERLSMDCHLITTNGYERHLKFRVPDYYVLIDDVACARFESQGRDIQHSGGRLITLDFNAREAAVRKVPHCDLYLRTARRPRNSEGFIDFEPGVMVEAGFSGLYALQFAVNMGALVVALMGMEGYPRTESLASIMHIGPFTQQVITQSPGTRFIFCGVPQYPLSGGNVTFIENPADLPGVFAEALKELC